MYIYIIVLILLIIPFFFRHEQSNSKYNNYYWFEFFVLFLLMGLRFRVGGDSLRYELYYSNSLTVEELYSNGWAFFLNGFQPLWTIYQAVCKSITDDFVLVQLINSCIVNGIIFYYVNENVKNRFTFVVLYYFVFYPYFNTEIMRESLSVVCFMIGYKSLVKQSYLKYYVICIVAFLFHASAVFLFVLPFIYPFFKRLKGVKMYILTILLALIVSYYVSYFVEFLNSTLFSGNSMLNEKSEDVLKSNGLNIYGVIIQTIYLLPIFFCIYIYRRDEDYGFVLKMYLLVSIIGMFFLPLMRMSNYFSILFLCIFSDVLKNNEIRQKYKFLLSLSLYVLLYSRMSYYTLDMKSDTGGIKDFKMYELYIPYHSYFDKEHDLKREKAIEDQF